MLATKDYIFMDLYDDFKKPGGRFYCKIITLVTDKMSVSSRITYWEMIMGGSQPSSFVDLLSV